jgi:hypothetical protein
MAPNRDIQKRLWHGMPWHGGRLPPSLSLALQERKNRSDVRGKVFADFQGIMEDAVHFALSNEKEGW